MLVFTFFDIFCTAMSPMLTFGTIIVFSTASLEFNLCDTAKYPLWLFCT